MWPPNFYLQSPFSTLACSPVPPNNLKCAYHQNWRLRGGYQMHTQDGSHVCHGSEDAELLADFTFSRITWQIFSRPPPLPFPVTATSLVPANHPHPRHPTLRPRALIMAPSLPLSTNMWAVLCACVFLQVFEEGGEYLQTFSFTMTSLLSDSTPSHVINCAVSWLVRNETPRSQPALCRVNHV